MKWMTRAGIALAAGSVMAVSGCGGSSLADDDPRGQEACDAVIEAIRFEGDTEQYTGQLLIAGQAAEKAKTEAIKSTVGEPIEGLEDFPIVDAEALYAACEEEGVEMPDSEKLS